MLFGTGPLISVVSASELSDSSIGWLGVPIARWLFVGVDAGFLDREFFRGSCCFCACSGNVSKPAAWTPLEWSISEQRDLDGKGIRVDIVI